MVYYTAWRKQTRSAASARSASRERDPRRRDPCDARPV